MSGVLVDTSIWIDHFRHGNAELLRLLEMDMAMVHPLVLGEMACGTPPNRAQTLADLGRLRHTQQASVSEAVAFLEREALFGQGCGLVDMLLLASTLITPGTAFWTLDKRLRTLAERSNVLHQPMRH